MSITVVDIEIVHKGKKHVGDCTIIQVPECAEFPYKFPLYRVAFNKNRIKPDIYVYYEINKPERRFYWYKHPEPSKEAMYNTICSTLKKLPQLK